MMFGSAGREQLAAGLAVQVEAERVLAVQLTGEARRDGAELRLRRIERLRAEVDEPADHAARERRVVDVLRVRGGLRRAVAALERDREFARIGRRRHCLQTVLRIADDERLPVADEHVVVAALLHDLHADHRTEVRDELIALIEQLVRLLAARAGDVDLLVEIGDLLRVAVDLRDGARQLRVDALAQLVVLLAGRVDLIRERLRAAHQRLARGGAARRVRHRLQAGEVARDALRDALGRIADEVVQLRDQRVIRAGRAARRLRVVHLRRQVLAVLARDGDGLNAVAEIARAGELTGRFLIRDLLERVARRRGVADVLSRRRQAPLGRIQTGKTNAEDVIGHA